MRTFENAENKSKCQWKQSIAVKQDHASCNYQMLSLSKKGNQDLILLFVRIVLIKARGILEKDTTFKQETDGP